MIKKQFVNPSSHVSLETMGIIERALSENFPNGDYPERFEIKVDLTAQELRQGYVLGLLPAELAADYDTFKKKKTTIRYWMSKDEIISILVEDEY
jgi:hypothetical protein